MTRAPIRPRARPRALLAILVVTVIWGWSFVWIKEGLDAAEAALPAGHERVGLALFLLGRFVLGALGLVLVLPSSRRGLDAGVWRGGSVLGGLLLVGFLLQMTGLQDVTPAVSAFLTSLYVVFTALLTVALTRKPLRPSLALGALLATLGASFISGPPQVSFGFGEWITVAGALVFAVHILATDRWTRRHAPLPLTLTSFLAVIAGSALVLALELLRDGAPGLETLGALLATRAFLVPLAACGFLATFVALSLMNLFQRELDPVRAAVLYTLEPVFASLISIAYGLGGTSKWLWIGGGALLAGNLVAELGGLRPRPRGSAAATAPTGE
jgi:drug/metabolite transporter (DMT)-like permease